MQIPNFQNDTRKFVAQKGNFYVLEYQKDASVSPECRGGIFHGQDGGTEEATGC